VNSLRPARQRLLGAPNRSAHAFVDLSLVIVYLTQNDCDGKKLSTRKTLVRSMMSPDDLARVRKEYSRHSLDEQLDVDLNPFVQFHHWFEEAMNAQLPEPNAMVLATASTDSKPSARVVLLKGFDERGFVFYTNYEGRKSVELTANPQAAVLFFWGELERQVRIEGTVERTSRQESEEYFRTRPLESRLSAWASKQSSVIPSRGYLEQKMSDLKSRYENLDIPLPPNWGGFRLQPEDFEFWQGRENRLHDRVRYTLQGGVWQIERLSP
jgi:pyridoxamine 5'-phosphate oxidase